MLFALGLLSLIAQVPGGDLPLDRTFRVQDHGAVGDGTALDTAALQKTIDTCSQAGGGRVYLSPGVYLTGTLFLKDNVRLTLEAGAVLKGSARAEDYPKVPRKDADLMPVVDSMSAGGAALIYAEGIRNASIEGPGTIDGRGATFWYEEMLSPKVRKPKPERPRALIAIIGSENLRFRDVTLVDSPCYTLWLIGCDHVNIDGIAIRNSHVGPNTDGIDIDCCNDVRVANCFIDGGDDAIAIKSDSTLFGADKPCENISVTNCVLCSVPACGVRVGYEGDSVIRDCTFSNLTIFDTDIGLDIVSVLPGGTHVLQGTRCENIVFDNIVMRNVNQGIYFWMGNLTDQEPRVHLKNIGVSNVIAQSHYGSYVGGFEKAQVENVTLSNVRLEIDGEMPENNAGGAVGVWGGPMNPYGLYCAWADSVQLLDIDLDFRSARGAWRYGVYCQSVTGAALRNIRTRGLNALGADAAVGSGHSTLSLRDSDAEPGINAFLHVTDGSQVFVSGCDASRAQTAGVADESSSIVGTSADAP